MPAQAYNPFPGLRPFEFDDNPHFFGRDEQTTELTTRLRKNRFVAVVGTSGSGKSSLVRAGLLPELLSGTMSGAGSSWETAIMRPGGDPLTNLAQSMVDADLYDPEEEDIAAQVRATLTRSGLGLVEAIRQSDLSQGTNFLLVVDQFEEIFRFRRSEDATDEQAAFFVNLLLEASAQSDLPLYVIITMRSDFLGECSQFPRLADNVNEGEFLIPRLNRDQRKEAILGPVKVAGGGMTDRLLLRLLNDIGDDPDQLPILQHALMRTWDLFAAQNESGDLDLEHYHATGGMNEALSRHADEVYGDLPDPEHQRLAQKLFKSLTEKVDTNRGIRRPMALKELHEICGGEEAHLRSVVDAFRRTGCTFLMPAGEAEITLKTIIDISHESLMRVWKTLKDWVDDEAQSAKIYRRLADTASLYADDKAGLYRNPDLGIALAWRQENQPNQTWADRYYPGFPEAMAFLEASQREAEREAREKEEARKRELAQAKALAKAEKEKAESERQAATKLKRLIGALSIATLVAIAATALAFNSMVEAKQSEQKAVIANNKFLSSFKELSEREAAELVEKGAYNQAIEKYSQIIEKTGFTSYLQESINQLIRDHNIGIMVGVNQSSRHSKNNHIEKMAKNAEKEDQLERLLAEGFKKITSKENFIVLAKDEETIYCPLHFNWIFRSDIAEPNSFWSFEKEAPAQFAFISKSGDLIFKHHSQEKDWKRNYRNVEIVELHYINSKNEFAAFTSKGDVLKINLSDPAYDTLNKSDRLEQIKAAGVTPDTTRSWVLYSDKLIIKNMIDGRILTEFIEPGLDWPHFSKSGLLAGVFKSSGEILIFHTITGNLIKRIYTSKAGVDEILYDEHERSISVYFADGDVFSSPINAIPKLPIAENHTTEEITDLLKVLAGDCASEKERQVLDMLPTKIPRLTSNHIFTYPHNTTHEDFYQNSANLISSFLQEKYGDQYAINDRILSIKGTSQNYLPVHEPKKAIDGIPSSKYLNFDKDGSGLIIEIDRCQLTGFNLTSGDDNPSRDPKSYELYGSDDGGITYRMVHKGTIETFTQRLQRQEIRLPNPSFYKQYKIIFDTIVDSTITDAFQIAEIELIGSEITTTWPEYVTYYKLLQHLAKENEQTAFELPLTDIFDYSELPLARDTQIRNLADRPEINLHQNDLSGWHGDKKMWSSINETIKAKVGDGSNENKYLINVDHEPLDFDLRIKFRIARGNSGINFRNDIPVRLNQLYGSTRLHEFMICGYQADFSGGDGFWNGKLIVDNLQNKAPLLVGNPGESIAFDAFRNKKQIPKMGVDETVVVPQIYQKYPNWNEYRIVCLGDNISIYLNGTKILHLIDRYKLHPSTGKIGLQLLGNGEVNFKDIHLKVLSENVLETNRRSTSKNNGEQFALEFLSGKLNQSRSSLDKLAEVDELLKPIAQKVLLSHPTYLKELLLIVESHQVQAFKEKVIDAASLPELDRFIQHPLKASILNFACAVGASGVVEHIIETGIDVNQKTGAFGFTALHVAVIKNDFEIVKMLIEAGADVNASNINGFTPIIEASKWASPEIVSYLLENGAEIGRRNITRSTGLHEIANIRRTFDMDDWTTSSMRDYALSDRRLQVFRRLLIAGADLMRKNNQNKTAVDLAESNQDAPLLKITEEVNKR